MQIDYSVSLWNYTHYAPDDSLEEMIDRVREQGWGIELWGSWLGEDLYSEPARKRLKGHLEGMKVSLHTAAAHTLERHKKQIDAASDYGARIIVVHEYDFFAKGGKGLDAKLASDAVKYASGCGVRLALENGSVHFLKEAQEKVEDLGICLDVGHVYLTGSTMKDVLDVIKTRLIHLHLQDVLPELEEGITGTGRDHYIPGTGGIPQDDWKLLAKTLKEINFEGTAVFEIRPRVPLQTSYLGRHFMEGLLGS